MTDKNYSLLRPFDLEAARRGEPICLHDGEALQDVTITKFGTISGRLDSNSTESIWSGATREDFRMAPLCWVEGKPVYKGDVLYRLAEAQRFVANSIYHCNDGDVFLFDSNRRCVRVDEAAMVCDITWTPSKIKREGFVCITHLHSDTFVIRGGLSNTVVRNGQIFTTYEAAQEWANTCKDVVCIVPLTWEESGRKEEEDLQGSALP